MEDIKQKFEELLEICEKHTGDMYQVTKATIAYKLKAHLEEIYKLDTDPIPLLSKEIDNAIVLMKSTSTFNETFKDHNLKENPFASKQISRDEDKVHSLYGSLWVDFDAKTYFEEAYLLLKTRLERNDVDISWFKGKKILDAGCGGGRYTCALSKLGAKKVIGVDIGTQGIKDARERIKGTEFEGNVEFIEHSVLDLPFDDCEFDFVFSNGVLHHTTDPEKGIAENHRVLKKGGMMWIYLYGDSGLEELLFSYIRKILSTVPREITQTVMAIIGLPANRRFYMLDHFYVEIRKTYPEPEVIRMLKEKGFKNIRRLVRGVDFDTTEKVFQKRPFSAAKYGTGDLRFLADK